MSMINDALRRASHAAKSGGGTPPPPPPLMPSMPVAPPPPPFIAAPAFPPPPPVAPFEEALPPVSEFADEPTSKSTKVQIILALLLVLAVGVAGAVNYRVNKSRLARAEASSTAGKKPILANPSEAPSQANALAAAAAKVPTPPVVVATAPVVVAPEPPVKFPPLRLQSIFYRPANPSVMINGKTLFITDEINGVKVADIQPSNVTLVLSSQTNVLTLR